MANLCIRITVGKIEANEKGREYKFRIGKPNIKISNTVILDLIEEGIETKLTNTFGFAAEQR